MKHLILLLIFICGAKQSTAQMRFKNQNAIAINGGAATKGYYGNINYQRQISDKGSIIRGDIDYTFTSRNINVISGNIESNITTFGVAYSYSLQNIFGNRFFVQPYLGGFGGFESYGIADSLAEFVDGSTDDGFVYGIYGGLELEYNVSNSISITLNGSHSFNLKSDINDNITKGGGGLKIYF